MTPDRRGLRGALALALLVLVSAWASRVSEGRRALRDCDAAVARGDRVEAIVFARTAAEARCPFCSAPELGFARLYAIAKDAEGKADDVTAAAAWRAVRAATLAGAVLDRAPARRDRAEIELARLEHRIDAAGAAAGGNASPAATEERLRASFATTLVPSALVFVFLALGGGLLLYGALRAVRAVRLPPADLAIAGAGGALALVGVLLF